jgi:hypothetical protein
MRIAIVCNGYSAVLNKNGRFINSCDHVIRMNKFRIANHTQWVGSKIDIISLMITGSGVTSGLLGYVGLLEMVPLAKSIWIADKNRPEHIGSRQLAIDHFRLKPNVFKFIPDQVYDNLYDRMKAESEKLGDVRDIYYPDSGMTLIDACVQVFQGAEIYVTGFDPHRKHPFCYYWEQPGGALIDCYNSHPQKAEAVIYDELIRERKIIEI